MASNNNITIITDAGFVKTDLDGGFTVAEAIGFAAFKSKDADVSDYVADKVVTVNGDEASDLDMELRAGDTVCAMPGRAAKGGTPGAAL